MATSPKILTLSTDDHALLTATAMTHKSRDTRIKAEGLLHLFQTQDLPYSAQELFVDEDILKAWVDAWQENGIEGLSEGDVPYGPDTIYTDLALTHYLAEILEEYPDSYGVDADDWTVELLIDHLATVTHREMGISEFTDLMAFIGWHTTPIRPIEDYGYGITSTAELDKLAQRVADRSPRQRYLERLWEDDLDRMEAFFEGIRDDE